MKCPRDFAGSAIEFVQVPGSRNQNLPSLSSPLDLTSLLLKLEGSCGWCKYCRIVPVAGSKL